MNQKKTELILEGNAQLLIYRGEKISKELPVFYNPVMKHNRDITIALLSVISNQNMRIADILAASGVRGIRMFQELPQKKIETLFLNDFDAESVSLMKKNLKLNKLSEQIKTKKIVLMQKDANLFMLEENGFDFIDIDPFGCPNVFLDSAIKRIARNGILAVTATDTSALAGTFPLVCLRKYWANPMHNELMHEIAVRILVRKVQLVAAQYEKAMIPLYSYATQHYVRVFFQSKKGKKDVDALLKQHLFFLYCNKCMKQVVRSGNIMLCCGQNMISAGPIYGGALWDQNLAKRIYTFAAQNKFMNQDKELLKLTRLLAEESGINSVGFFDLHTFVEKYGYSVIPKFSLVFELLKKKQIIASRTHFNEYSIKAECDIVQMGEIVKSLFQKE